jgi:hypothetical protein
MNTLFLILHLLGWLAAVLLFAHIKVKASAVLIHHATHRQLLHPRWMSDAARLRLNRGVAEFIGILSLSAPFDIYKKGEDNQGGHDAHHAYKSFATLRDDEARGLYALGFRPGTSRADLWRLFWRTLFSPGFHAREAARRIKANVGAGGWQRRWTAGAIWVSMTAAAAVAQVLPGFLLGCVLPLLAAGNVASFLELVSRHRWLVDTVDPRRRHHELSHGRFQGAMPPDEGALLAWLGWVACMVMALVGRITVVPGDLAWHIAHHIGLERLETQGPPAWVDAASSYSALFWRDEALSSQSHATLASAIDAWFVALEQQEDR